jgi:hypothetical protein
LATSLPASVTHFEYFSSFWLLAPLLPLVPPVEPPAPRPAEAEPAELGEQLVERLGAGGRGDS